MSSACSNAAGCDWLASRFLLVLAGNAAQMEQLYMAQPWSSLRIFDNTQTNTRPVNHHEWMPCSANLSGATQHQNGVCSSKCKRVGDHHLGGEPFACLIGNIVQIALGITLLQVHRW